MVQLGKVQDWLRSAQDINGDDKVIQFRGLHGRESRITGGRTDGVVNDLGDQRTLGWFNGSNAAAQLACPLQRDKSTGGSVRVGDFSEEAFSRIQDTLLSDEGLDGLDGQAHKRMSAFGHGSCRLHSTTVRHHRMVWFSMREAAGG